MQQHDSLIGPVPARVVEVARSTLTAFDGRVADFNVAAWLHLPGITDLPVSLMVAYMDGSQRREVAVDHGKLNPKGKILLSGVARLPFKHKVEQMQVRLRSLAGQPCLHQWLNIHCPRRRRCPSQVVGLWITRFSLAQCCHLASDQEILEPLRPPVHVELLQQLQDCRGRQFLRLVA